MTDTFVPGIADRIKEHAARKAALRVRGGGTKDFYGAPSVRTGPRAGQRFRDHGV